MHFTTCQLQRQARRLIELIIILGFLMSISPVGAVYAFSAHSSVPQDLNYQGVASATAIVATNAYAGPSTAFWIVGTVNRFETLPILAASPDRAWWLVNGRFGNGWVAASAVTANNAAGVAVRQPDPSITITTAVLNVRGGPGPEAQLLGRLSAGSQVYLIGRSNDGTWLNIEWQFGTGWVMARFTSAGDAAPTTSAAGAPVTEAEGFAVVSAGALNVRSGPGVNYAVIGQVVGGERLPIIGRSSDSAWYNVQTVFGDGWVSRRFVILRNEFGNAPVTTDTVDSSTLVGPFAIINTGALNVRSGPAATFTVLGAVSGGDQFHIIARDASFGWLQVETPFGSGWVSRRFVIIRGDTSSLAIADATTPITVVDPVTGATTVTTPTLVGPVAFVATGTLNIRSGPNIGFDSIGAVDSTTRMSIVGQSMDRRWWQVNSPFGLGWVNKNYVLVEGNASSVPVVP